MEILAVLLLVVSAAILFATEALRVDAVAIIILVALALSSLLTPEEVLSGFSNPATATVAAMFVLSAALKETGLVEGATAWLGETFRRAPIVLYLAILLIAATVSAFINNTAAVAVFIPVVLGLEAHGGLKSHRVLMPLSFAAQVGGVCTLIGTSTNILVSDIALRAGQPAFGMFEFTALGASFALFALLYLLFVPLLFLRRSETADSLVERYTMHDYLAELSVEPGSPIVGTTVEELSRRPGFGVRVLEIHRDGRPLGIPLPHDVIQERDVLLAIGPVKELLKTRSVPGLKFRRDMAAVDPTLRVGELGLVEALVPPASPLVGSTLEETRFRQKHSSQALAIRHHDEVRRDRVGRLRLAVGDVLLLQGPRRNLDAMRDGGEVILLEEVRNWKIDWPKAIGALAIMAGVVSGAAIGIAPVLVLAIAGCAALVVTRIVTMEQGYAAIDWKVVFLLAGVIPLGIALEKTGAASLIADGIVRGLGQWGPIAVLAAFYVATTLLTEVISNNAAAALVAPLALAAAAELHVDPRPLLVAVMFAASTCFITPVGYQTNAMVLGPGGYRFSDFTRVGLPLNLAFCVLAVVLIPRFFPF